MRQAGFILLLFFALQLLTGCSSVVPPTVTQRPLIPITEEPTIILIASAEYERIEQSLKSAGLVPVQTSSEANYQLTVDIGNSRAGYECGKLANVRYTLHRGAARVLEIKGRGKTGSCEPNIFDGISQKLASYYQ